MAIKYEAILLPALIISVYHVTGIPVHNDNPQKYSIHKEKANKILDRFPVIDGHNDLAMHTRGLIFNDLRKVNFSDDLTKVEPWASLTDSQTDLPRLRKGKVGGQFWVAYTPCSSNNKDSVSMTIEQIDVIKRLVQEYPNDMQFATSADDIEAAIANKKIASLIAVEGGHSIQSSAGVLRIFYEIGVRYLTLTHNCNTPWSDAAQVDAATNPISPASHGLSEFGLEIIDEMNRLGMMVDLSHVSAATMRAALNRSKAPIIFSHSNTRAVCNHHRNAPDDVILKVKENDGLIMVNFVPDFVQCDPSKNATIADVVAHMEHIKNLIGSNHIGIGADYNGMEVPVQGLGDVSKYPELFAALLEAGNWSEQELENVAGRNLIRVLRKVEEVRDTLRNEVKMQTTITKADTERANLTTGCITSRFIDE